MTIVAERDVFVEDCGSIAMLTPMTPAAREWIAENVATEPWQWMGCSLACEPRMLAAMVEGMVEDGLIVE